MRLVWLIVPAVLLTACGNGGGSGVQVETAWCEEMLESDIMARSLRGEMPGSTIEQAQAQCVLVPIGTPFTVIEEAQNPFMQTFIKAEIVRPDTGETAVLWVRKNAAGIQ